MYGKTGNMEIRSKINNRLLHIIHRKADFKEGRTDLIQPDNFLQCSALKLKKEKTFRPHRHIPRTRTIDIIAQESWIVISGCVKVIYYDIDDSLLMTDILKAGDACFTLAGGHTYEILEDAIVYEMKTGPYEGQKLDKIFIDE